MKKSNKILRTLLGIVIVLVIIVAGGVVYLSVNEYKPDEKQNILVQGATTNKRIYTCI